MNYQGHAWENKGYHHFILVEDGPVIIKCDKCGASLSCSNPSQSTSIHTTACTARKREYEDAVARRRSPRGKGARPGEDPGGSPSGSGQCALPKRQQTLDHTVVTAAQQASFDRNFSLFIYTTETPFWRCKNKFLKRAAQALGARVRDEKWFRTTQLDIIYADGDEEVALSHSLE